MGDALVGFMILICDHVKCQEIFDVFLPISFIDENIAKLDSFLDAVIKIEVLHQHSMKGNHTWEKLSLGKTTAKSSVIRLLMLT